MYRRPRSTMITSVRIVKSSFTSTCAERITVGERGVSRDPSPGNTAVTAPPVCIAVRATRGPARRLAMRNTATGIPTVPMTPIGSRKKILISSQVSLARARIICLLPDRVPREREKHVFEVWQLGLEVRDPDAMFGEALDDKRHQIAAAPPNRALAV